MDDVDTDIVPQHPKVFEQLRCGKRRVALIGQVAEDLALGAPAECCDQTAELEVPANPSGAPDSIRKHHVETVNEDQRRLLAGICQELTGDRLPHRRILLFGCDDRDVFLRVFAKLQLPPRGPLQPALPVTTSSSSPWKK